VTKTVRGLKRRWRAGPVLAMTKRHGVVHCFGGLCGSKLHLFARLEGRRRQIFALSPRWTGF